MEKKLSLVAVFFVFLAMGFGDAAGQLVSVVEKAFDITPFLASFVSFSGMIMFGVLSVPMGVQQSKIGKKKCWSSDSSCSFWVPFCRSSRSTSPSSCWPCC